MSLKPSNHELRKKKQDARRNNLSVKNRLLSIVHDSIFVSRLNEKLFKGHKIPLIPNERCGVWYLKPESYNTSCYFKSTDGHVNQWDFSARRLNFHLLPIIQNSEAICIIDSTRSGKIVPDSLSKTVPIWCAVIGKALHNEMSWDHLLFLPPDNIVGKSEKNNILAKMPSLYKKFTELDIDIPAQIRPLRPVWIYPGMEVTENTITQLLASRFEPIFLITASQKVEDGQIDMDGYTYVQGAADDHELWSNGLTPSLFWNGIDKFQDVGLSPNEFEINCKTAVENGLKRKGGSLKMTQLTQQLFIGKIDQCTQLKEYQLVILLDEHAKADNDHTEVYKVTSGTKVGSRKLRIILPEIIEGVGKLLHDGGKVAILCGNGEDMSVGVALACLCRYYDEDWTLKDVDQIDKTIIHRHLARIVEKRRVQPSRATLNSVNYYLMSARWKH